jgi:hypothetical protein
MPLVLSLTTEQKQNVKLAPVTAAGKPATLDSVPVWAVTAGAGTVVPAADGLSAFVVSTDVVDGVDTVITVSAEGDVTPGTDTLTDTITVTTVHALAANMGLSVDPPVAKP